MDGSFERLALEEGEGEAAPNGGVVSAIDDGETRVSFTNDNVQRPMDVGFHWTYRHA